MKRFILFLVIVLSVACQPKKQEGMTLNVNIEGLKKGTLYLQKFDSLQNLQTIDSALANGNGKFFFRTDLQTPEIFCLFLEKENANNQQNRIFFFAEPTEISVETHNESFDLTFSISGSETQKQWENYSKAIREFSKRNLDLLAAQLQAIKDKNMQKADSLAQISNKNKTRQALYSLNFALNNNQSYIAPYVVLTEGENIQTKYLDSVYNSLTQEVAKSKYGKELQEYIQLRKQ